MCWITSARKDAPGDPVEDRRRLRGNADEERRRQKRKPGRRPPKKEAAHSAPLPLPRGARAAPVVPALGIVVVGRRPLRRSLGVEGLELLDEPHVRLQRKVERREALGKGKPNGDGNDNTLDLKDSVGSTWGFRLGSRWHTERGDLGPWAHGDDGRWESREAFPFNMDSAIFLWDSLSGSNIFAKIPSCPLATTWWNTVDCDVETFSNASTVMCGTSASTTRCKSALPSGRFGVSTAQSNGVHLPGVLSDLVVTFAISG